MRFVMSKPIAICAVLLVFTGLALASTVEIKDAANFVPYDYNRSFYNVGGAFVGCGPTTGAMVLDYFQRENGYSNLLTNGSGLDTAWTLHGATYMNTNAAGFGSVYNIKPGIQNYVASRSPEVIAGQTHNYSAQVTIHVGPSYDANNPGSYNNYGAFGDAWTNDATFYKQDGTGNWYIDQAAFFTQVSGWLSNGTAVWLTVNSTNTGSRGADHWIPLIGVTNDNGLYQYEYYNTWDLNTHWADIDYMFDNTKTYDPFMINYVRTVAWTDVVTGGGPNTTVPEPASLVLLATGLSSIGVAVRRRKKA